MKKEYPKHIYDSVSYVTFEGVRMPCMSGYDEYLRMVFGDYMQLPPKKTVCLIMILPILTLILRVPNMMQKGSQNMEQRLKNREKDDFESLIKLLKSEADLKYRDFHSSLVPNNDKSVFIGIRVPRLREISKEIAKENPRSFLESATDEYYEIRMLKAYVIGLIKTKDFNDFASLFDSFVPSVDIVGRCVTDFVAPSKR